MSSDEHEVNAFIDIYACMREDKIYNVALPVNEHVYIAFNMTASAANELEIDFCVSPQLGFHKSHQRRKLVSLLYCYCYLCKCPTTYLHECESDESISLQSRVHELRETSYIICTFHVLSKSIIFCSLT